MDIKSIPAALYLECWSGVEAKQKKAKTKTKTEVAASRHRRVGMRHYSTEFDVAARQHLHIGRHAVKPSMILESFAPTKWFGDREGREGKGKEQDAWGVRCARLRRFIVQWILKLNRGWIVVREIGQRPFMLNGHHIHRSRRLQHVSPNKPAQRERNDDRRKKKILICTVNRKEESSGVCVRAFWRRCVRRIRGLERWIEVHIACYPNREPVQSHR